MVDEIIRVDFGYGDEIERSIDNHPAGKAVPERERALLEAEKWSNRIDIAREGYDKALDRCRELGISNTAIARAVGKGEAAVRMHFLRKKERK